MTQEAPGVSIDLTVVELDDALHAALNETLADCRSVGAHTTLIEDDFIAWAISTPDRFDLVI